MSTEKNTQCESCELSFVWGKMKTVAQETAFHIAQRCRDEVSVIYDSSEEELYSQKHILAEACC